MPKVTLVLTRSDGKVDRLPLQLKRSPLTKEIIAALEAEKRRALQARWSGLATCIHLGDKIAIPKGAEESEKDDELVRGQVAFSPDFNELVLAYGPVLFYDNERSNCECYPIGKVPNADLSTLDEVGNSIWQEGARTVEID